MAKPIILYIAKAEDYTDFKMRTDSIKDEYRIATLKDFDTQDIEKSFARIAKHMRNGTAEWTIFHLPSIGSVIGYLEFTEKIKWLIREECIKRSRTVIIDPEGKIKKKFKPNFLKLGVMIVSSPAEIGVPFNKILTDEELKQKEYNEKYPLFAEIDDKPQYEKIKEEAEQAIKEATHSNNSILENENNAATTEDIRSDGSDGRLPGMFTNTPTTVDKTISDPFAQINENFVNEEVDPFTTYNNKMQEALDIKKTADAITKQTQTENEDLFADPFGNDLFSDDLFDNDIFNDSVVNNTPVNTSSSDTDLFDDPFGDPFGDPFSDNFGDNNIASNQINNDVDDDLFADAVFGDTLSQSQDTDDLFGDDDLFDPFN